MESQVKTIELETLNIEIIEASSWTRGEYRNRPVKKPRVVLNYKGDTYFIEDHKVIFDMLNYIDDELKYKDYRNMTSVPENILRELLLDGFGAFNTTIIVNVVDGVIVEVPKMDKAWLEVNEEALEALSRYCEGKLGCGLKTAVLTDRNGMIFRVIHSDEQRILEVIQKNDEIKLRGRYKIGAGYMQVIDPVIFKGNLGTIEVIKLYECIDSIIEALQILPLLLFKANEVGAVKNTYKMKGKEQDALERAWFRNSFVN